MTETLELGKGEFYTIEAFYFELEDGCFYETELYEAVDCYWHEHTIFDNCDTLDEYVKHICETNLTEDDRVMVSVVPRRYAIFVDGLLDEYGDSCMGQEDYIWNGTKLITQEEYITEASLSASSSNSSHSTYS